MENAPADSPQVGPGLAAPLFGGSKGLGGGEIALLVFLPQKTRGRHRGVHRAAESL